MNTDYTNISLGTEVTLPSGSRYHCLSDGYFKVSCDYNKNTYRTGYISYQATGGSYFAFTVTSPVGSNSTSYPSIAVFVKKGLYLSWEGSGSGSSYFYPLQYSWMM